MTRCSIRTTFRRLVVPIAALAALGATGGVVTTAVAASADADLPSQQLRFIDNSRGNIVYSVLATGPNQKGKVVSTCVATPGHVTDKANWWWSGRTNVDTFRSNNCTGAHATVHLWFDVNPTTYWRCLEDAPPYPDYSCGEAKPAPRKRLVVMGDSYASGEGTYNGGNNPAPSVNYDPRTATWTDRCHRSPAAYGPLLGVEGPDFVACSGATTGTIVRGSNGENSQLSRLDANVGTVILSAGGNDVGFSNVLGQCVDVPGFHGRSFSDCQGAVAAAYAKMPAALASLTSLYGTIGGRTAGAHLVVMGYPRLFPAGGHFGCNWIGEDRQRMINQATDAFDDQLRARTGAIRGATFVDVRALFTGHEVCGGTSGAFINDLQLHIAGTNCPDWYVVDGVCSQSFHPNVPGYRAEAQLLASLIGPHPGR